MLLTIRRVMKFRTWCFGVTASGFGDISPFGQVLVNGIFVPEKLPLVISRRVGGDRVGYVFAARGRHARARKPCFVPLVWGMIFP